MPTETETMNNQKDNNNEMITIYRDIPYAVLDDDLSGSLKNDFFSELNQIKKYYNIYDKGSEFNTEGTGGDYIASDKRFKKIRKIINEEARFMFSQPIDVIINKNAGNNELEKKNNTIVNDFIKRVLKKNGFNAKLLKSAKDCFIGKRVAMVLNFNDDGIKIDFLNSLEFYYEITGDDITKFVAFFVDTEAANSKDRRVRKKTYELIDGYCWIEEKLFDGAGTELEVLFEYQQTPLEIIPAWIVFNDGLINDVRGESDVAEMIADESWYSKIANADIDALRKSMNPTKYAIDASSQSTSNLSTGPGAFWDIQSDENGVDQKTAKVGMLEPNMSYSQALGATLDRIDNAMHSEMSVPNIDSEKLQGLITSGKTLKALYWPMTVRTDEKMQSWYPAIESLIETIYKGALIFTKSTEKYLYDELPIIDIDISLDVNYALPEDEEEEKTIDLSEVAAQTMSRKSYMKKWRGLTDEEADNELKQIALERQILEDTFSGMNDGLNDDEGEVDNMLSE